MSFRIESLGLSELETLSPLPTLRIEELDIERTYLVEGGTLPEYDSSKGYFIFRGLTQKHNRAKIGIPWTEMLHHAYVHSFSNNGQRGDLFVARMHTEEIRQKAISYKGGDDVIQQLQEYPPQGIFLDDDPTHARLVTGEELSLIFSKVPANIYQVPGWAALIDWRNLSLDVFGNH